MNLLERFEALIRAGVLPDPRTTAGVIVYAVIGFALGLWLGSL